MEFIVRDNLTSDLKDKEGITNREIGILEKAQKDLPVALNQSVRSKFIFQVGKP